MAGPNAPAIAAADGTGMKGPSLSHESEVYPEPDIEALKLPQGEVNIVQHNDEEIQDLGLFRKVSNILLRWGIETHGYVCHRRLYTRSYCC